MAEKKRGKRLPKEVRAMVDGGLNLLNIIIAIVVAVKTLAAKLKKTDAEWTTALHQLSTPKGAAKIQRFAEIVLGVVAAPVVVIQRTWQDMLNACKQYWFNPDFTEARYPLEPVVADEAEWKVEEHFFDDDATGTKKLPRLAEMVKRGEIRICGVRRAEEDTADHLDIQLDHPRIIPVSAPDSGGILCLPAFHCHWDDVRERQLYLYRVSNDFNRRCGWLVLRKRP